MGGSGKHSAVRRTPSGGRPRLDPASYVTTDSHDTFELMVRAHGRNPTSSFLMLPVQRRSGPAFAGVSRFLPLKGMESSGKPVPYAVHSVRDPTTECRAAVIPNRRLYIGPHVQEYLVGFHDEWEEHLTRWVLAVRNALRTDTALPLFLPAGVAQPQGEALASESDPRGRGQIETADAVNRATENPQIAKGSDVTSLGRSEIPLKQPSAASAILGATVSATVRTFAGTEGGVSATRGRRGQPRGSGRGSRPNSTGRGSATNRGRIPRAGGS